MQWEELTPTVLRTRLPHWDATSGVVAGPGGLLVVDTGSSPGEGAALRYAAETWCGRPVTHVALTHGHFDHVLGTAAFGEAEVYGPVGLEGVLDAGRDGLHEDAVRHGMPPGAAEAAVAALVLPGHGVSGELTLDAGGRQVLLANVGPGHTAHDLAVFVPPGGPGEREVVFCGDVVEESGPPQAGPDAHPARWPEALDRLLALGGEDALYVPGHGRTVDAAFVRAQRDTLAREAR